MSHDPPFDRGTGDRHRSCHGLLLLVYVRAAAADHPAVSHRHAIDTALSDVASADLYTDGAIAGSAYPISRGDHGDG